MAKVGRPKGSKNGQHKAPAASIKVGKHGANTTLGLRVSIGKRAKNA